MTEQHCTPTHFHYSEWVSVLQEKYGFIGTPSNSQTETRFFKQPTSYFPPTDLPPPDWWFSEKRQEFDHHSARIISSGLIGADLAVEYLREIYRNNLSISTIRQASYVVLSFLNFLRKTGTNVFKVTRQDIKKSIVIRFAAKLNILSPEFHSVLAHSGRIALGSL